MTNYLSVIEHNMYHYFYESGKGICRRIRGGGMWRETEVIYAEGLDKFCVFHDGAHHVHILCTNQECEIVYLLWKNNQWHRCVITKCKQDIVPLTFRIGTAQGRIQMFYSAKYQEEIILVHCVLGLNALPSTLDKMLEDSYCIFDNKVYYTNEYGVLGYQDFADGKPDRFITLYENGKMPYASHDGLVWKQKNTLMFRDKALFEDFYAENPILVRNRDQLMLMWQSGDFVRYMTSFNDGATWSAPMRFVSTNRRVQRYFVQNELEMTCYYGNHNQNEVSIFGKSDITDIAAPQQEKKTAEAQETIEIQKLKIMIELMKGEIAEIKRQNIQLRQMIEQLKE